MSDTETLTTLPATRRCECTNLITDPDPDADKCDDCSWAAGQPPHVGHRAWFTGEWFCDTCDSPVCELS